MTKRTHSKRIAKKLWYDLGAWANSKLWRREVSGRWIYYAMKD